MVKTVVLGQAIHFIQQFWSNYTLYTVLMTYFTVNEVVCGGLYNLYSSPLIVLVYTIWQDKFIQFINQALNSLTNYTIILEQFIQFKLQYWNSLYSLYSITAVVNSVFTVVMGYSIQFIQQSWCSLYISNVFMQQSWSSSYTLYSSPGVIIHFIYQCWSSL